MDILWINRQVIHSLHNIPRYPQPIHMVSTQFESFVNIFVYGSRVCFIPQSGILHLASDFAQTFSKKEQGKYSNFPSRDTKYFATQEQSKVLSLFINWAG